MSPQPPFVPYTPPRRTRPAGIIEFLWIAWREPLGIWSERHFKDFVLYGESRLGKAMTVSDPAGVRHVLVDNAAAYHKGPVQRRVLGPLLGEGLLLVEDEDWRRARRILAPLFTPRRVTATAGRMRQIAEARVASWPTEGVVQIDREMTRLTFEILSATLFSDALGGEAAEFEEALNDFIAAGARIDPLDVIGAPGWIPRVGRIAARSSTAFFEQRVAQLVAARRTMIEGGQTAPDDLTTALLRAQDPETGQGLTERQVLANILTFILAGHETTARALGWALHLLSRTPSALAEVEREAALLDVTAKDFEDRMPWTRAVLEEALRLFPTAPLMTREAQRPDEVCGRRIEAGTTILIAPYVLHRHKKLWEDPDAFRPERFLPGARESIDRFAYLPFSAGPRVCIGASFAMQEAIIALSVLCGAHHIEPTGDPEPTPEHRITLRPREGIRLRVNRR